MRQSNLLHELLTVAAQRGPDAPALTDRNRTLGFARLQGDVDQIAAA